MQKQSLITALFTKKSPKIYPIENKNTCEYVLKFDGCSKGNPGPSGAGAVLYHNENEIWSDNQYIGNKKTNNYAEYYGLILGLKEANRQNIQTLHVCGDSLLVIKQMNGEYKLKSENLYQLYNEAKKLEETFVNITYEHIYRQYNKRADELANLALENELFLDEFKSGF